MRIRHKRLVNFLIGIILIGSIPYSLFVYSSRNPNPPAYILNNFNDALKTEAKPKTIVYWNNFFGEKHFGYGIGQSPFHSAGCHVKNCLLWDQADGPSSIPIKQFDAVIFHTLYLPTRPQERSPHQRYIFFLRESPSTETRDYSSYHDFFNWTITYRRDSDIYIPYGFIVNKSTPIGGFLPDTNPTWMEPVFNDVSEHRKIQISTKTKLIAWFVSHCGANSERGTYVSHLSKHIPVDIYGKCGTLTCRRSESHKCNSMIEQTYKFYLAFENSLCVDYVTEKFFRTMTLDIVPIVYGGADYSLFAPPMSYIDVKDYASLEDLARYLLFLDENPDEYEKYFWWKKYYKVSLRLDHILCNLCERLNNPNLPNKVYDIQRWWHVPNICHSAMDHFEHSYYKENVFNFKVWKIIYVVLLLLTCACVLLGFIYYVYNLRSKS